MSRKRTKASGPGRADEAALIARARGGDPEAEHAIYREHRQRVASNLLRVLGNRAEIEDLVQEVFVIAFRGLGRFRGHALLSTWLYRITMNVALGSIRRRSRRPQALDLEAAAAHATDPRDRPDRRLEREQDRELCYRVMERLAPKKRLVLYLHEIEGMDLKDIAELVGAHPVTVRTRLFYAKREFYRLASAELADRDARGGTE